MGNLSSCVDVWSCEDGGNVYGAVEDDGGQWFVRNCYTSVKAQLPTPSPVGGGKQNQGGSEGWKIMSGFRYDCSDYVVVVDGGVIGVKDANYDGDVGSYRSVSLEELSLRSVKALDCKAGEEEDGVIYIVAVSEEGRTAVIEYNVISGVFENKMCDGNDVEDGVCCVCFCNDDSSSGDKDDHETESDGNYREVEFICLTSSGTVKKYTLPEKAKTLRPTTTKRIGVLDPKSVSPSPSSSYYMITTPSSVVVCDSSFSLVVTRVTCSNVARSAWVGNDCVIISSSTSLSLVSPYGETREIGVTGVIGVKGERDGVRVICGEGVWDCCRVNAAVEDIFKPGSISEASTVHSSNVTPSSITPSAIQTLNTAIVHTTGSVAKSIANSKKCIGDGRSSLESMKLSRLFTTFTKCGISVTPTRYLHSPQNALVNVCNMGRTKLARGICSYLRINTPCVPYYALRHFVRSLLERYVIKGRERRGDGRVFKAVEIAALVNSEFLQHRSSNDDAAGVMSRIALYVSNFLSKSRVDVKHVPSHAVTTLILALLKCDASSAHRVQALIKMGMWTEAAKDAKCDVGLAMDVIIKFELHCGGVSDAYISEVKTWPEDVVVLICKYFSETSRLDELVKVLMSTSQIDEAINVTLSSSPRLPALAECNKLLSSAKSRTSKHASLLSVITSQMKLSNVVKSVNTTYSTSLPLTTPLISLLRHITLQAITRQSEAREIFNHARGVGKEFKVPERRVEEAIVGGMGEGGMWGHCECFNDGRRGMIKSCYCTFFFSVFVFLLYPSLSLSLSAFVGNKAVHSLDCRIFLIC